MNKKFCSSLFWIVTTDLYILLFIPFMSHKYDIVFYTSGCDYNFKGIYFVFYGYIWNCVYILQIVCTHLLYDDSNYHQMNNNIRHKRTHTLTITDEQRLITSILTYPTLLTISIHTEYCMIFLGSTS